MSSIDSSPPIRVVLRPIGSAVPLAEHVREIAREPGVRQEL
jgi:hypothetical protein